MKNSVTFISSATRNAAEVRVDGRLTIIDLAALSRDERVDVGLALWDWSRKGFVGFPVLTKGEKG